ncbi:MAG: phage integrase N-terminal SAM-like domain-containing protein, partial [Planctomycetaceae bacterium]|nr:phage integrase N-terminal SAM-like domain-containing protein [Planctomycetaceae bacterium]
MANIYKPVVIKIDKNTGEKIKSKTKKWYGRYRDENRVERRVPLSENKTVALQMLADIVKRIEQIKSGLVYSAEFEMKKPISEHLADYEKHLKSKNNTPRHIHDSISKIQRCIESCHWKNPAQISASDVESFLVDLRNEYGCSVETSNHYLRAIKAFCRWMYLNKRIIEHPLLSLTNLNSRVDRRHDRRAL